MIYLKKYLQFFEDGTSSASSTAGMGAVSSSQPGGLPGTTGTEGSGDVGFVFRKEKRKKGDVTEVSDMRDLEPAKGVTHVEEIKESEMTLRPRDPASDLETRKMIDDCLVELYDLDFKVKTMYYNKLSKEELLIGLNKNFQDIWTGNIIINCKFDESGIISKDVRTLRAAGKSLSEDEQRIFDLVEEVAQKLIGNLDYQNGSFEIAWEGSSGNPYPKMNISVNVHFTLENNLKN